MACRWHLQNVTWVILSTLGNTRIERRSGSFFKNGHLLPSLFVLLPNKSEETYCRMWTKVSDFCLDACPTHLIVDFEKAAINAKLGCYLR